MYRFARNLKRVAEKIIQPRSHMGVVNSPLFEKNMSYILNPNSPLLSEGQSYVFHLIADELLDRGVLVPDTLRLGEAETKALQRRFPFTPVKDTFFRVASSQPSRLTSDLDSVCFLSVPYDDGSTKPGTRYGPELLREVSWTYTWRGEVIDLHQKTALDFRSVYDLGVLHLPEHRHSDRLEILAELTEQLPANCRTIMVGGDHSYTYSVVKALQQRHPEMAYVHIDSHTDMQTWNSAEGGLDQIVHSNFVSHLAASCPQMKMAIFGAKALVPVSPSRRQNFLSEFERVSWYLDEEQLDSLTREEMAYAIPKGYPIYLSLDVDVLARAFLTQTGHANPSGLSPQVLIRLLTTLLSHNRLIGADVMEFGRSSQRDEHRAEANLVIGMILRLLSKVLESE